MAVKSPTSQSIDAVVELGPASLLKDCGYRKVGRSFNAESAELFKVVQFQSSMWNARESGQFTVNLKLVLPYYHEKWTGQPFPKNPASGAPIVEERIGWLMPVKRDFWWTITPKRNARRIGLQVTKALSEFGLPFLERHSDLESLVREADRYRTTHGVAANADLYLAILLTFQGKRSRAAQIVRELAEENTHAGFARTIEIVAQRLGLRVRHPRNRRS